MKAIKYSFNACTINNSINILLAVCVLLFNKKSKKLFTISILQSPDRMIDALRFSLSASFTKGRVGYLADSDSNATYF